MIERVVSPGLYAPPQYAHASVVAAGTRLAFLAGSVPLDAEGELVGAGDVVAQTRQALANLEEQLRDIGSSLEHVVRTEVYVVSTDPAELPALAFVKETPSRGFEVTRTTFLHGSLLRQGDVLKGETLSASDLQKAAALLAQNLAPGSKQRTIALFDLSERNLARHGLGTLEQAFQVVR